MKLPQSWTTVTTLSKILAIILFVSLPFTGFYFGFKYHQKISASETGQLLEKAQESNIAQVSPTQQPIPDKRLCISGEIPDSFDETFFVGKTFEDMTMSGEWGTLESDFKLPIKWGLDWAGPDDKRPNSGVGGWWIETNGKKLELSLSRTTISDGIYTDFKYFKYKENVFAIPSERLSLIIGPSKTSIDDFFDKVVKQCW